MSTKAVSWAIHNFKTNEPNTKLVLILLAENADSIGLCWPSQKLTADKAGCSVSTVKRVIKKLESIGAIKVERRRVGRHKTVNRYILNIEKDFNLIRGEGVTVTPSNNEALTDQHPEGQQGPGKCEGVTVNHSDASFDTAAMGPILFQMSVDWIPCEAALEVLSGLNHIPNDFTLSQVPDFIIYWGEAEIRLHQGAWDNKFMDNIRKRWTWAQSTMKRNETIEQTITRMTDRSWAE